MVKRMNIMFQQIPVVRDVEIRLEHMVINLDESPDDVSSRLYIFVIIWDPKKGVFILKKNNKFPLYIDACCYRISWVGLKVHYLSSSRFPN